MNPQSLDAVQRVEGAFGQTLDLVVVEREQSQVFQVFEGRRSDTVDLIGVQQPAAQQFKTMTQV